MYMYVCVCVYTNFPALLITELSSNEHTQRRDLVLQIIFSPLKGTTG